MNESKDIQKTGTRDVAPADESFRIPAVDIFETQDSVVLLADMPGVTDKSIDVTVERDELTIVGHVEPNSAAGVRRYSEYTPLSFRRSFVLSGDMRRDGIEGRMQNGVLRLTLPKADKAKVHRIAIKS